MRAPLLLLALAALFAPTTAATAAATIPVPYRGEWSLDPAFCGMEGDDEGNRLFVADRHVGFHAEPHGVIGVRTLRGGGIALGYAPLVDATMDPPAVLKLSRDGRRLTDGSGALVWTRCPVRGR